MYEQCLEWRYSPSPCALLFIAFFLLSSYNGYQISPLPSSHNSYGFIRTLFTFELLTNTILGLFNFTLICPYHSPNTWCTFVRYFRSSKGCPSPLMLKHSCILSLESFWGASVDKHLLYVGVFLGAWITTRLFSTWTYFQITLTTRTII